VWLLAIGKILHQFAKRKNVANAITLMGAKAGVTSVCFTHVLMSKIILMLQVFNMFTS
jgi:tRNA threonylcarbamoyladenosine modification (KEOPS) complex Cgi121 subunit